MSEDQEHAALVGISVLTVVTGAAQATVPGRLLGPLGTQDSPPTRQLFGTVGMFMVIVGGMLFGALRRPVQAHQVILWAGAQKLGAAGAVALGVKRAVFSPRALVVAAFDLASGLVALDYWRRVRHL